ncbi:hypothetical protein SVAN01_01802 [Stagonosporopsis vannaccii]|nr:hypothetical protein SVAN01_01802 [Stagonosporopsis vannaccii]
MTSFPNPLQGPPRLAKEFDAQKAKAANDSAKAEAKEKPQENWLKKKRARYYELNDMAHVKPEFDKMTYPRFQQNMIDAQE